MWAGGGVKEPGGCDPLQGARVQGTESFVTASTIANSTFCEWCAAACSGQQPAAGRSLGLECCKNKLQTSRQSGGGQ